MPVLKKEKYMNDISQEEGWLFTPTANGNYTPAHLHFFFFFFVIVGLLL